MYLVNKLEQVMESHVGAKKSVHESLLTKKLRALEDARGY
jgi:hypothetical protein